MYLPIFARILSGVLIEAQNISRFAGLRLCQRKSEKVNAKMRDENAEDTRRSID